MLKKLLPLELKEWIKFDLGGAPLPDEAGARARHGRYLDAFLDRMNHKARGLLVGSPPMPAAGTTSVALVEHIGDIVAAGPIARALKARHPEGAVAWIARRPYAELAAAIPHVDHVVPVFCLSQWLRMRQRARFDRVIDLHVPGKFCDECVVGPRKTQPGGAIDLANFLREGSLLSAFCKIGGLAPLDEGPSLRIPAEAARVVEALALPPRYVVIHRATRDPRKAWAPDKWERLVRFIAEPLATPVVEVGQVAPGAPPPTIDLCGKLRILETAEVIRRARLFVGVDSGPAHLANALSVPGVVLLGRIRDFFPYNPFSGAYGTGEHTLSFDGPVREMALDRVQEAVAARIEAGGR
jgi:ADP-heptose:LPS heptosyltransferase